MGMLIALTYSENELVGFYLHFAQSMSDVLRRCGLQRDGQHALGLVQPAQH